MAFRDRKDAGIQLAARLAKLGVSKDAVVLGIPRGGVSVAYEIAKAIGAPLDIFLSKKLGVPGQEELAFGAIAANGYRFLDERLIQSEGITTEQVDRLSQEALRLLEDRSKLYRSGWPETRLSRRTAILVDDGIATGASIYAAILALREYQPSKLIVAVPVAPDSVCRWLAQFTDQLICLCEPKNFYAVGQFYYNFEQVPDEVVRNCLRQAKEFAVPPDAS